jgi:hypothetical protein
VVIAEWMTRTVDALHHGITTVDSLWYHMPFAARFVQDGSIVHLHYVDTEPVVPFYPATSELLHAVAIEFVSNDFLSPLLNLGWMALVLLAAWCIGRPFGVAPISLIGACVLLGTPGLVATQPGGAYDDVVGLALFLSSIAILTNTVRGNDQLQLPGVAMAALAAGLACGTKYTLVGPVAILTIGIYVVCRRGQRLPALAVWTGLVVLTGGFWYVKNWAYEGNPLPSLSHIGPLKLASPPITSPSTTVGHYLFDWTIWRHYFIPGMRSSLGPASWAILACSIAGLVCLLGWGRSALYRMVAIVGIGSAIVFIYTPQFLGLPGAPFYFVYNIRYATPALLVGLVLFPLIPILSRRQAPFWVGLGLVAIMCVTQLDATIWPIHVFTEEFSKPVAGIDSLLGLLFGVAFLLGGLVIWIGRRHGTAWRPGPPLIAAVLILLLAVGYPIQRQYLADRYTTIGVGSTVAPRIVKWAQDLHDQRIAVDGPFMMLQYQYYGRDLSNYVQFLAQIFPNGGMNQYQSCQQWLKALDDGHFNYLFTLTPTEQRWARADPDATLVMSELIKNNYSLDVFKLGRHVGLSACDPQKSLTS